jgi:outer membrane lipoprotein SlyB
VIVLFLSQPNLDSITLLHIWDTPCARTPQRLKRFNMALEHKNAAGTFPDRQQTELALSQLKATGFPMNHVSVVVQHLDSEDAIFESLTEPTVQSENRFAFNRTIERIEHGALDAGAWGTIGGGLIAGLTTLALPEVGGSVLLVGMAAGAFYGAVSGGLLGAAIGVGISDEQASHYGDRLTQGYYLVVIKGADLEIGQAGSLLKTSGIQDWIIFDTL